MVRKVKSLPDVLLQRIGRRSEDYLAGLPVSSRVKARLLMEWGKMFDVPFPNRIILMCAVRRLGYGSEV